MHSRSLGEFATGLGLRGASMYDLRSCCAATIHRSGRAVRGVRKRPGNGLAMFGWITRFSLQFRILVLALAAGIIAFGIVNVPRIAVDTMPEFAPAQVEIQTEALGLSAVEVEQLITAPMEADLLNGVAWLDEIRSKSVRGCRPSNSSSSPAQTCCGHASSSPKE